LVKAKGEHVPTIALPAASSIIGQFVNGETGLCWEATYDGTDVKKNDGGLLKARSKP
jgi:hypothetical protein